MIITGKGTRTPRTYFAVDVLCYVKNIMDLIFVSCKPKGGLSQAWVMSGTDTISEADIILPYNMQHCGCELKDPTINFPYSNESLFFLSFFFFPTIFFVAFLNILESFTWRKYVCLKYIILIFCMCLCVCAHVCTKLYTEYLSNIKQYSRYLKKCVFCTHHGAYFLLITTANSIELWRFALILPVKTTEKTTPHIRRSCTRSCEILFFPKQNFVIKCWQAKYYIFLLPD